MPAAQPGTWPMPLSRRRTEPLEVLSIDGLPEDALPAFEAAFQTVCATVGYFKDDPTETWRIEGVREAGAGDDELTGALAIAALVSGIEPPVLTAGPIEAYHHPAIARRVRDMRRPHQEAPADGGLGEDRDGPRQPALGLDRSGRQHRRLDPADQRGN
ncbi:MAG: hypothetical protein EON47_18065, partial [Acetobacteraceae bacterium]